MSDILVLVSFLLAGTFAVPACKSNEGEPGRFPLWPSTYDMQKSTIIQPCNESGFLNVTHYSQYGVVSVDWSNAKQLWVNPPMSCEELFVEQAALLKAANPDIRVMGYRQLVKALPWFTSIRNKMDDPKYASWFLPFNPHNTTPYHVKQCDNNYNPPKCTALYHDEEQTPGYPTGDGNCPGPCDCGVHPCGEYLINWLTDDIANLSDFMINDFILGPTLLGNANISGAYLDDEWYNQSMFGPGECSGSPVGGPTEEDSHCLVDTGHAGDLAWTTAMTDAWCTVRHRAFEAVRLAGGWFWQMFSTFSSPVQAQCASTLRPLCEAGASSIYHNSTTVHAFSGNHTTLPNLDQDLAMFLLLRGDYAFLGTGWVGCGHVAIFPDVLKSDFGVPSGFCEETGANSGVFTREWTKAKVSMDCNTYKGTITMK